METEKRPLMTKNEFITLCCLFIITIMLLVYLIFRVNELTAAVNELARLINEELSSLVAGMQGIR